MGLPRAAKYSVYVTLFQSLLIGLFFMIIILLTKDYFAIIFTSSKELQRAVSKIAFLLGITMVLNSVQPVVSGANSNGFLFCSFTFDYIFVSFLSVGVAIGGGWQALVAYINIGSYYIFGLPLGYLLGYKAKLGVTVCIRYIIL